MNQPKDGMLMAEQLLFHRSPLFVNLDIACDQAAQKNFVSFVKARRGNDGFRKRCSKIGIAYVNMLAHGKIKWKRSKTIM
jgi:hypothetical protein